MSVGIGSEQSSPVRVLPNTTMYTTGTSLFVHALAASSDLLISGLAACITGGSRIPAVRRFKQTLAGMSSNVEHVSFY